MLLLLLRHKDPKGTLRVISLLPVFYIFSILPWSFSSVFLRTISSFFITWITSFKLLLFCFNRGPLVTSQTYLDFITLAIFPTKIRQQINSPSPNLETSIKLLGPILPILISFYIYGKNYPLFISILTIFLGLYMWFSCGATWVRAMARYEFMPLANRPYLATSLQDFWGRRWNRIGSNILRITVYDPTPEALVGVFGFDPAKVVAMMTTLVVSGIAHELVFYYITRGMRPTWDVTWYFLLQGVGMLFETGWKNWARAKGWNSRVNPICLRVLTVGFVIVTANWLIVLPIWRSAQSSCDLGM